MENKINLVELLKYCPKGMELDSPLFERLEFDRIDEYEEIFPIICKCKDMEGKSHIQTFTAEGSYEHFSYCKCVIFPKGKTTWEGFQSPSFKCSTSRLKKINEEAQKYSREICNLRDGITEQALYTEEAFRVGALWAYNNLIYDTCEWMKLSIEQFKLSMLKTHGED